MECGAIGRVGTDESKYRNARAMMRRASVMADCVALGLATFAAIALCGAVAP